MSFTPLQPIEFRGHRLYVKRDDLYSPANLFCDQAPPSETEGLVLSGNKARKLQFLFAAGSSEISQIQSYGSVQSNMLAALAILSQLKGWKLNFYVGHIPENLAQHPRGNYLAALNAGAKIIAVGQDRDLRVAAESFASVSDSKLGNLFVPEGGAMADAEAGLKCLADELIAQSEQLGLKRPKLMLPSGTGTSAYFLQKHLPFEVLTCACVGSSTYLREQMATLEDNNENYPTILPEVHDAKGAQRKFQFGKLYAELFELWQELKQGTGTTFDLLYDPIGWSHLLDYLESHQSRVTTSPPDIIYLHQGGLLGNQSMLQRYARKLGF